MKQFLLTLGVCALAGLSSAALADTETTHAPQSQGTVSSGQHATMPSLPTATAPASSSDAATDQTSTAPSEQSTTPPLPTAAAPSSSDDVAANQTEANSDAEHAETNQSASTNNHANTEDSN